MSWYKTGQCLEPITLEHRSFLGRQKLPNGKVVNVYRAKQKGSMNKWQFYYFRGQRFLITDSDYSNSRGVL